MPTFRDVLVGISLTSALEAYVILQFAPQIKPAGGLGHLWFYLSLINVALTISYFWFILPYFVSPLRHLPQPKEKTYIFPLGHGLAFWSRPPGDKFLQWIDTTPNDGLILMRGVCNRNMLVVARHEALKAILSDDPYNYVKPRQVASTLKGVLGEGLILVEGDVHKFQRKHLMPSFQLKEIRDLYPLFWAKSCELAQNVGPTDSEKAAVKSNEFEVEFGQWCMRSTLDIIGFAGFGKDFNTIKNPDNPIVQQYHELLEPNAEKLIWFGMRLVLGPIINTLPWELSKRWMGITQNLNKYTLDLVKERRALQAAGKGTDMVDILSSLVRSNDFTDQELAYQCLTMMAAGHETTSSALSWALYLLATHPDIQEKVRAEVRANLPSPDSQAEGKTITAAQIDSLPWLNAVCNETTRLYPTVPITLRESIKETYIGNQKIPAETLFVIVPWAINRSKQFWGENAEAFKPDRWINPNGTPNNHGGSDSNYAQMTFLHGPRSCIGQGFAKSELKCLLAAVAGRYEVALSRAQDQYFPNGLVTTKPAHGLWLKMKDIGGW